MKKIGIMGGTFNPIHNAHLMMAQAAYEQYNLNEIWFMPSHNPPHKKKGDIVSDAHRKRMVQHAIDGYSHFHFSDFELQREGITYTCETLEQLTKQKPESEFYFILGGDSLIDFEHWYKPQKIVRLCTVLAASREGLSDQETEELCMSLGQQFHGNVLPVKMPQFRISSAMIRDRLANGQSAVGFCPESVVHYIEIHELYGSSMAKVPYKEKDRIASLSALLRPKRYRHTIGVAMTAAQLAVCHGESEERARTAGLLHDCAKYLTDKEMYNLCDIYRIVLSPFEKSNPALVHSKLGAYLAKQRYGIEDEEICSAIAFHTTGRPKMTTLEKIIYLADYIEPYRKLNCQPYSLNQVRKTCFRDLDQGLLMTLKNTISYLERNKIDADPMTRETYDYYKSVATVPPGKSDIK